LLFYCSCGCTNAHKFYVMPTYVACLVICCVLCSNYNILWARYVARLVLYQEGILAKIIYLLETTALIVRI